MIDVITTPTVDIIALAKMAPLSSGGLARGAGGGEGKSPPPPPPADPKKGAPKYLPAQFQTSPTWGGGGGGRGGGGGGVSTSPGQTCKCPLDKLLLCLPTPRDRHLNDHPPRHISYTPLDTIYCHL